MNSNQEQEKVDKVDLLDGGKQSHADASGFPSIKESMPDTVGTREDGDGEKGSGFPSQPIVMTKREFDSKEYNMKNRQAGRAIVINNKNFRKFQRNSNDRKTRKHTDRDRDAIVNLLKNLGFVGVGYTDQKTKQIVKESKMVFEDVKKADLLQLLNDAGNDSINDYTDMDCFICVILSFGEPGAIYCPGNTDKDLDEIVELKKLMEPLKGNRCRTLVMKPKLFFIQGCPYVEKDVADAAGARMDQVVTKKVPVEADFLTQSCHLSGWVGWSEGKETTSWYIRALCKALQQFCIDEVKKSPNQRSLHFMTVLTRVNRFVAEFMDAEGYTPDRTFQLPLVTSLLTKHMYFYPKQTTTK